MNGPLASEIKREPARAKAHSEERGIRMEVVDAGVLRAIELPVNSGLPH